MAIGFQARYRFHCDECDGDIAENEEYVEFQGMNFCVDCWNNHRHDLDIDEEDTEVVCECCGETITEGEYYVFDGEPFCLDCVDSNKCETTQAEKNLCEKMDRSWERRF